MLPDLSWKQSAKRKIRCDSQTCCKIPMRICSFSFKGCPTNYMMHQPLRNKGYVPIRIAGWPARGCQTLEALCQAQSKVSQPDVLQDTHADVLFSVQRVYHKPYDAPSLAQQRLRANPNSWLPYKRLPDPPWKHFAKRKNRVPHADLFFLVRRVSHKPYDATSFAQVTAGLVARYPCGFGLFGSEGVLRAT